MIITDIKEIEKKMNWNDLNRNDILDKNDNLTNKLSIIKPLYEEEKEKLLTILEDKYKIQELKNKIEKNKEQIIENDISPIDFYYIFSKLYYNLLLDSEYYRFFDIYLEKHLIELYDEIVFKDLIYEENYTTNQLAIRNVDDDSITGYFPTIYTNEDMLKLINNLILFHKILKIFSKFYEKYLKYILYNDEDEINNFNDILADNHVYFLYENVKLFKLDNTFQNFNIEVLDKEIILNFNGFCFFAFKLDNLNSLKEVINYMKKHTLKKD